MLSVASRTDGGQREIYQFKGSVALNKKQIKHKEKEIFRVSFFRFDYALDFSA